jgi:hypothetical protein
MMEYGGLQADFINRNKEQSQNLNNELRQKMVSDELAKLQSGLDSDFYVQGNEKINPDTVGENAIAKNIYDKDRGYLDNVRDRMIAAGITGTALKGGLEIIAKIRAGKNPQILPNKDLSQIGSKYLITFS